MADEGLLRFRVGRDGTAQTLYVSGELDIASAPAFEQTVAGTMDGQSGEFCLDVSALTFMDSTGARALLHVHNRVESVGRRLVVLSPTRPVWRVLKIMGLDQVMDVRLNPNGDTAS
ncbi:MAG: STAS domain-containing protein [Acidimicrobiia bacterium]